MAKNVDDEMLREAQLLGIEAEVLSPEDGERLVETVTQKFAQGKRYWLWEAFGDAGRIVNPDSWQKISTFPEGNLPILFFNRSEGEAVIRFNSFHEVVRVLAECTLFEFYITDADGSFLVSCNHHDVLSGVGEAATWIKGIDSI